MTGLPPLAPLPSLLWSSYYIGLTWVPKALFQNCGRDSAAPTPTISPFYRAFTKSHLHRFWGTTPHKFLEALSYVKPMSCYAQTGNSPFPFLLQAWSWSHLALRPHSWGVKKVREPWPWKEFNPVTSKGQGSQNLTFALGPARKCWIRTEKKFQRKLSSRFLW